MSASASSPRGKRIEFIDLLRGWAVIVMIETHVSNATLSAEITSGAFFQYVTFVNGLVAPSFLFASGLAFAVTTRRKIGEYLNLGPPLVRQSGRLLLIWLIGYALHVPVFSLKKLTSNTHATEWQSFFQVDILQCIAASLALLLVLLVVLRTERRLYHAALITGILVVLSSPFIWRIDFWEITPWPVAGYMNGIRYSLFPLFPWSAFLLAGAVTGYYYIEARQRQQTGRDPHAESSTMRSLLWAGGSSILLGVVIGPAASAVYPEHPYWHSGPGFFLLRLGVVLILTAGLFFFSQSETTRFRNAVLLFGRESLLVYVLHLLLIYGNFGPFNFRNFAGRSFGYGEAMATNVALIALMFLAATVWGRIKSESPRVQRMVNISTLALVLGMFIFGSG
jgi:uncharacterized membrane protein